MSLLPPDVRNLLPERLVVLRNWDVFDCCAGAARIAKWAILGGLSGVALDSAYGAHMDFNMAGGMAVAFLCLVRIVVGGLLFMGPKCSSWVWVNRGTAKRSLANVWGARDFVSETTRPSAWAGEGGCLS